MRFDPGDVIYRLRSHRLCHSGWSIKFSALPKVALVSRPATDFLDGGSPKAAGTR